MAWRFRKSIRLFPGVRLNLGKRGFTSVRVGGEAGGVTLNVQGASASLPVVAGLSWRQRLVRWARP